jgi:tetratricopeptide (TPR) repeat protein
MSKDNFDTLDGAPTIPGEPDGQVLSGRYKIVREIGSGGMGTVYLAQDMELDIEVAIKVLPTLLANNKRAIDNLRREAKTALKLSHPNIVRLHTFHSDEAIKYLVMEYVDGGSLEEKISANGVLSVDETLKTFTQVAAGLDYAHSQNVLHRDIKPANIMLTKDGIAKLADFGIARQIKESMTRITGKETSGTLLYMAPEQFRGGEPDHRSDIYSLAASIYECLSGHPPFWRGSIEYQVMNEKPASLGKLNDEQNVALLKALAKDPKSRQANAKELLADLGVSSTEFNWQTSPRQKEGKSYKDTLDYAKTMQPQGSALKNNKRIKLLLIVGLLVTFAAIFITALLKEYATRYPDVIETTNMSKDTRVDEAQQIEAIRLKTQAEEFWSRIKIISRDNGFGNMLDSAATLIQSGQSSIEMKAYSAAINFYTELLEKCKSIETLENQRKAAFESKLKFEEEIRKYNQDKIREYGGEAWLNIEASLEKTKSEPNNFPKIASAYAEAKQMVPVAVNESLKYADSTIRIKVSVYYPDSATEEMRASTNTLFYIDKELVKDVQIPPDETQEVELKQIKPGTHELTVKHKFFGDIVRNIMTKPWETTETDIKLDNKLWVSGTVSIKVKQFVPKLFYLLTIGPYGVKKFEGTISKEGNLIEKVPVGKYKVSIFAKDTWYQPENTWESQKNNWYEEKEVIVQPGVETITIFEGLSVTSIQPTGVVSCARKETVQLGKGFVKIFTLELPESGWIGIRLRGQPWKIDVDSVPYNEGHPSCGIGYLGVVSSEGDAYTFNNNASNRLSYCLQIGPKNTLGGVAGAAHIGSPGKVYIKVLWEQTSLSFEGFEIKTRFWSDTEVLESKQEIIDFYDKIFVPAMNRNSYLSWRSVVWPNSPADRTMLYSQQNNRNTDRDKVYDHYGTVFDYDSALCWSSATPEIIQPYGEYMLLRMKNDCVGMFLSKQNEEWKIWFFSWCGVLNP